jgi:hypothetical protein
MSQIAWRRMLLTIAVAVAVVGLVYLLRPSWFDTDSTYTLPIVPGTSTLGPRPTQPRPQPTPTLAIPRVGLTQHLDNVWVTPYHLERSQGGSGIFPNLGDEFLVVSLRIANKSDTDFRVSAGDFMVLDSHGQIDPPLINDFTRRRIREVRLVPLGFTSGTLIFEVPKADTSAELIYQPDFLSPSKHKIWILR